MATVTARSERRRRAQGYVPPPDEGLIVTDRYGRPVQRGDFNRKFRAAVELAGLGPVFWIFVDQAAASDAVHRKAPDRSSYLAVFARFGNAARCRSWRRGPTKIRKTGPS
ncbi:hypothetical protein GCM10022245_19160 [Streptomyces mayteni]